MPAPTIADVRARQILDSRGRPTVEVDVLTNADVSGRASVPSGASTGSSEAHELRDGDNTVFEGLGVSRAVANVMGEIRQALLGRAVHDQRGIDDLLRQLDGTPQLMRLGANAILGTSLAVCRASAAGARQPLYRRIAELAGGSGLTLPIPMVNIFSGGLHAGRGMDVQDFLAVPMSATSMLDAIHLVARVRNSAARVLTERNLPTLLADEGGLSPQSETGRDALELMIEAIDRAGLTPGQDIAIAIDVAAHSLYDPESNRYVLRREGRTLAAPQMISLYREWVTDYPIVSIEDGLDEEDWSGWIALTHEIGTRVTLVGDDLFTTNADRLAHGVREGAANGILIKLNQNGTLTGTLDVLNAAQQAGYTPVVSARSGETEDDFLADLAVGSGAGQIKIGSLRTSDRLSKYNQLLRIAEDDTVCLARAPRTAGSVPTATP